MNILQSKTVEAHFLTMMHQAGVDVQRPDVRQVWEVFKQFAPLKVECSAERCVESFLLECGSYSFSGGAACLHFSRNFHIGDQGAAWTEMVDCDFTFAPHSELENTNIYIEHFASDYEHPSHALAAFIAEVEAQTELWKVLNKHEPTQTFIGCHGV